MRDDFEIQLPYTGVGRGSVHVTMSIVLCQGISYLGPFVAADHGAWPSEHKLVSLIHDECQALGPSVVQEHLDPENTSHTPRYPMVIPRSCNVNKRSYQSRHLPITARRRILVVYGDAEDLACYASQGAVVWWAAQLFFLAICGSVTTHIHLL